MSMPVVLKPSRVLRGRPRSASTVDDTLLVSGSSRKSEGSGTILAPASAATQVVAGAIEKVPTTTTSESGKPLFSMTAKTGWYWAWRVFSAFSAQSGLVEGQVKSLGWPKMSVYVVEEGCSGTAALVLMPLAPPRSA